MRVNRLDEMVKGWVVGDFDPSVVRSREVEFAVKYYKAGEREDAHVHKVATEITVIVSGRVTMNGREFGPGDIVTLDPGVPTDFCCLTDVATAVLKLPSVAGDKYPV